MLDTLFPDINNKEKYRPITKNKYYLDEVRSAIQKAIRRSDEMSTMFWAFELYDSGMWRYLLRTLTTIAGEDIGLANPQAMNICMTAYSYFTLLTKEKGEKRKTVCKSCGNVEETKGYYSPNWLELGLLVSYLCHSPKNRHVDNMVNLVSEKRKQGWRLEIPIEALDSHCVRGRERLKNEGISPLREFFERGSKVVRYKPFNKKYEAKIKSELMKIFNLPDLINEVDELQSKSDDKI